MKREVDSWYFFNQPRSDPPAMIPLNKRSWPRLWHPHWYGFNEKGLRYASTNPDTRSTLEDDARGTSSDR